MPVGSKLVRRERAPPEVRLGEASAFEPVVQPWLGARFAVPPAKERDVVLDPAPRRRRGTQE